MVADLLGLTAAFVLLQGVLESSGDGVGKVPLDGELLLFACSLPDLARARPGDGALRPRRGAAGAHDDRRSRRRLPARDDRDLAQLRRRLGDRPRRPDLGKWIVFWATRDRVRRDSLAPVARFLARRSPQYVQNALVVGTDRTAQIIARKLLQHPEYRINVVGFVDASPKALQRGRRPACRLSAPRRI